MIEYAYKGRTYVVTRSPIGWCLEVAGGCYSIGDDPDNVRGFFRERLRSVASDPRPSLLASRRYPLIIQIGRILVRARVGFVPRGKGAKTYVNPATGERVATLKQDPWWWFEATGREPSPFGSASSEQTIADVTDLATLWLRASAGD